MFVLSTSAKLIVNMFSIGWVRTILSAEWSRHGCTCLALIRSWNYIICSRIISDANQHRSSSVRKDITQHENISPSDIHVFGVSRRCYVPISKINIPIHVYSFENYIHNFIFHWNVKYLIILYCRALLACKSRKRRHYGYVCLLVCSINKDGRHSWTMNMFNGVPGDR